jgi:hypothetical protein
MTDVPISKVCPQCGRNEYTARKSDAFVAFTDDRVCKDCRTRYSPPTPIWACILFMLSGLALPVLGFVFIGLLFNPFSILGLACEGGFCIVALVVFVSGISMLINVGR